MNLQVPFRLHFSEQSVHLHFHQSPAQSCHQSVEQPRFQSGFLQRFQVHLGMHIQVCFHFLRSPAQLCVQSAAQQNFLIAVLQHFQSAIHQLFMQLEKVIKSTLL
jgi:hypothetical protein